MLLPKARQDKLTVRELPDETLIYDHLAAKAHCLRQTAALVWKHCDGRTTVAELAGLLQRELGVPVAGLMRSAVLLVVVLAGCSNTRNETTKTEQDTRPLHTHRTFSENGLMQSENGMVQNIPEAK